MWSVDKVRVCARTQTGYLIFDFISFKYDAFRFDGPTKIFDFNGLGL